MSLGCATENLVHAAVAAGLQADARFNPAGQGVIAVKLEATQKRVMPLLHAIAQRQRTGGYYDGRPTSLAELRLLEKAGTGGGVSVRHNQLALLTASQQVKPARRYDAREIDDSPAPVQRYFRAVLKDGQPLIITATFELAGSINMSAASEDWKQFTSWQQAVFHHAGFL